MVSGASLAAKRIAENMATRGHKVMVITASERGDGYSSINSNLTVSRLRSIHNPMRVGQRFLLYPRRTILRSLHKFRPDIIHTHEPLQMGLLSLEYAHRANIPILLSIHQLPWFVSAYLPEVYGVRHVAENLLWAYARWSLRQYTALVTPSQTITKIITSMSGIESHTISYGIDLKKFHPPLSSDNESAMRNQLNLPSKVPVILHVGRLDADKSVNRVIRAAARTMQYSNAHLLIVGDGRKKSALMKMCKYLGIEKRSHFPGFISIEEGLPDIYRMATLFVTASEIETQGIVLLEAAASGLPIVAIRATCIPEIVHDGVNGYLIKPGDNSAFSRAIIDLLINPSKARYMGEVGRRFVAEHDINTTVDSYELLYADLIKWKEKQYIPEIVKGHNWRERAKEWLNL
jgi:glycosyltransferase involved in cell wall biosynthesis